MHPKDEFVHQIRLACENYLRANSTTSDHRTQILDDLDKPLQTQKKLIREQRRERKQLAREDEKRLAGDRAQIDHVYKTQMAFIRVLERSIREKPTGEKPNNVDSTDTDEDEGDGTNQAHTSPRDGERYPTAPPSPQSNQFSQANKHPSSTEEAGSSKRTASTPGAPHQSRSGVKHARGRSHSSGREAKKAVNYPDLRSSVGPATDHETDRSQPVTPNSEKNIFVAERIFTGRGEVSYSEEDSPSLPKNVPRAKKKSREHSIGPPRRSTRERGKVHYPK